MGGVFGSIPAIFSFKPKYNNAFSLKELIA
jgi:hypothetical protein